LPNRLLTQAISLPPPRIAKYEKEYEACARNHRDNLNSKWSVDEGNKTKRGRQKQNGKDYEHPPFFENYETGTTLLTLGISVRHRKMFDQRDIAIGAAANVGLILGLALGAEHGRAATIACLPRNRILGMWEFDPKSHFPRSGLIKTWHQQPET